MAGGKEVVGELEGKHRCCPHSLECGREKGQICILHVYDQCILNYSPIALIWVVEAALREKDRAFTGEREAFFRLRAPGHVLSLMPPATAADWAIPTPAIVLHRFCLGASGS